MTKIDDDDRFRAFGRVVARDVREDELEDVVGACASSTLTSTWTPQGDDKDTDCEDSTSLECTSLPSLEA